MTTIEFDDFVDDSRELNLKLPVDFPPGKVRIVVESLDDDDDVFPLTFQGLTLGEIVASEYIGTWADLGIQDSQAWVDAVRRQEEERRGWQTDS